MTDTIGSIIIRNDPVLEPEPFLLNLCPMDTLGHAEARFQKYTPLDRAEGGYWAASFTVLAREIILKELYENALGRTIEVWGYGLEPDFEGRIEEIVFVLPPDRFTIGLRTLGNKAHMRADLDGDGEVDRSTVIEHDESQALYGIADSVMSGGQLAGESVADQTIQSLINLRALPKPAAQFGGETGVSTIEVFARGFITTLEQRVYNQTAETGNQSLSSQIRDVIGTRGEVATSSLLDSLVSWWSLDEYSAGTGAITRLDSHGTNDLTDNNTTASATGKVKRGADFELANAEYMNHVDNASLSTGDIDFTIACWVKAESLAATAYIMSKWGLANNSEYTLFYGLGTNRFYFTVSNNGVALVGVQANTLGAPVIGTEYFIVCWHDSVANTINIQVNNGGVDSLAHATGVFDGASDFTLGADHAGANPFDGIVDEALFSKKIFSITEKTAIYNAGNGIPYTDIGRIDLLGGVGEFIESIETEANTTPVTQEYDMDRKASSIVTDLPRLGDSKANRWLLDCYGRDCTGVRGRRAKLHQASPVLPPE